MTVIDANVQPNFRYNAEIRKFLGPEHKLRSIPDVEQQWYQAPGGDYRSDLYGDGYPGSDPDTVARHLFAEGRATYALARLPVTFRALEKLLQGELLAPSAARGRERVAIRAIYAVSRAAAAATGTTGSRSAASS